MHLLAAGCPASTLKLGDPHHLQPLSPSEVALPVDHHLLKRVAALSIEHYAAPSTWARVVHSVQTAGALNAAVLGMSSTAGCGVKSPTLACDPDSSWARRMHDELVPSLHALPNGPRLRSRITYRNAVSPLFYESCIAEYAPPDTHVVLLEVLQNIVFDRHLRTPFDGVHALLRALRLAVPRAAVAFVAIPFPDGRQLGQETFWLPLRRLAAEHGCDIVHVVPAMQQPLPAFAAGDDDGVALWPASRFTLSAKAIDTWYAYHGVAVDHHPSQRGHQLIGTLAASFLRRQLQKGASARPPPPAMDAPQAAKGQLREVCFGDGQLPVGKGTEGFALRDEGTPEKGIKKAGLVSTRLGDVLRIGPLRAQDLYARAQSAAPECALATGRLGYFATTRPGQGSLHLSCHGCSCWALNATSRGAFFAPGFMPFPLVRTDSLMHVQEMANKSYSGTSTTVFHMALRRDATCYVVVRHVRSRKLDHHQAPDPHRPSHVRVDSFAASVDSAGGGGGADGQGGCGASTFENKKQVKNKNTAIK